MHEWGGGFGGGVRPMCNVIEKVKLDELTWGFSAEILKGEVQP